MITLLIATRNAHKVEEISVMLGPEFRCLTLNDFPGAPPVVEDADTFEGNAKKKADTLAEWLKGCSGPQPAYVLADDSGLEVDALNGAPGIYSARYAAMDPGTEGNSSDQANNEKLLNTLKNLPSRDRGARFRCVLALRPLEQAETLTVEGSCEGRITEKPSGKGGFGYDPLFVPEGYAESFADLGSVVKNRISHRSQALQKLKSLFKATP